MLFRGLKTTDKTNIITWDIHINRTSDRASIWDPPRGDIPARISCLKVDTVPAWYVSVLF
jgi:hypothetical protein